MPNTSLASFLRLGYLVLARSRRGWNVAVVANERSRMREQQCFQVVLYRMSYQHLALYQIGHFSLNLAERGAFFRSLGRTPDTQVR